MCILLKIKDTYDKIYNVYLIKYLDVDSVEDDKGEVIDNKLVTKIRFENEEWYRNFFSNDDDYKKNKYSDNKTEIIKDNIGNNKKYSTLVEVEEKEIYKTYEGKDYTYQEWKIFEEEYYKINKEKRNKKGF